jgi:hypothetical protein
VAVHEEVDHPIDHAKVIMAIELLLQIDEVAVYPVEPLGEETAKVQTDGGIRFKHGHGILDDPEAARFDRPDFSGVRQAKEGGEVPEDGTGFIGAGYRDPSLGDFDGTLDKEIEQTGGSAFGDDSLTRVEAAKRFMFEKIE